MPSTCKTHLCALLLSHWDSLADGQHIPSFTHWQDHFHSQLQPWLFVIDLHDDLSLTVRLMGTQISEMWGADLTGIELRSTFTAELVDMVYDAYRVIPKSRCGLLEYTIVKTAKGHIGQAETLALPLRGRPGQPDIAVAVTQYMAETFPSSAVDEKTEVGIIAVENRQWIDLGFGVPAKEPGQNISVQKAVKVTRHGPVFLD